jgi:hypothetical protein
VTLAAFNIGSITYGSIYRSLKNREEKPHLKKESFDSGSSKTMAKSLMVDLS